MLWEWLNQNLENCRSILSTNISAAHFLKSSNLHFDIYKINSSLESPLYLSGCNTQPKIKKKFFANYIKVSWIKTVNMYIIILIIYDKLFRVISEREKNVNIFYFSVKKISFRFCEFLRIRFVNENILNIFLHVEFYCTKSSFPGFCSFIKNRPNVVLKYFRTDCTQL